MRLLCGMLSSMIEGIKSVKLVENTHRILGGVKDFLASELYTEELKETPLT